MDAASSSTASATKTKLSPYVDEELANRARATFAHWSEWLEMAILHEAERLEVSSKRRAAMPASTARTNRHRPAAQLVKSLRLR